MKKPLLFVAAALTVLATPGVHAQNGSPPAIKTVRAAAPAQPAAAEPTPEQIESIHTAALLLRTFNIAFESKDVQQAVKGQLLSCLYNNKLSDIADATNRVLASNPNLKPSDPTTIYRAGAGVCGITFKTAGSPPPASGAKPVAPAKPATDGR